MGNQIEKSASANGFTRRELFRKLVPGLGSDTPTTQPTDLGIGTQSLVTDPSDPHPSILTLPVSRRTGLKAIAAAAAGVAGGAFADHLRPSVDSVMFAAKAVIDRRNKPQRAAETAPPELQTRETKYYTGSGDQERVIMQRDNENNTLFHTGAYIQKKGKNGELSTIAEGIASEISEGSAIYVSNTGQIRTQNLDTGEEYLVSETGDMPWLYKNEAVYVKNDKIYHHDITTGQEETVFEKTDKITQIETPLIHGNRIVWNQFNAQTSRWEIEIYDKTQRKSILDKPLSSPNRHYKMPSIWKNNLVFISYSLPYSPDTHTGSEVLYLNLENLPATELVNLTEGRPFADWCRNPVVGDTMFSYIRTQWEDPPTTRTNVVVAYLPPFGSPSKHKYPTTGHNVYLEAPAMSQKPESPSKSILRYAGEKKGIGITTPDKEIFEAVITTEGVFVPDHRIYVPAVQR